MSDNQITQFKWTINDFKAFYHPDDAKIDLSDYFELTGLPSVKFSLFYDQNSSAQISESNFGVMLQESKDVKALCMHVKFWLEDRDGANKREWIVEKHDFQNVGDKCIFTSKRDTVEWETFCDAWNNSQNMSFCCEINLLSPIIICVQAPKIPDEFRQKMWEFYQAGLEKDISIKVGDREFMISRMLLSMQCDVFSKMLSSNFKEGITGRIEIEDFNVATIECFIKWLYLGVIDPENLVEKLYLIADKYMIQDLKKQCADLMVATLTDDNVIERLILSVKFKSEQLKNAIFYFIAPKSNANFLKLFGSGRWHEFVTDDEELATQTMNDLYSKLQWFGASH